MSPHDVVLGRRKVILSLVYQLMRYHTMQLLESITAASQPQDQQQQGEANCTVRDDAVPLDESVAAAAAGVSPSVTPQIAGTSGGASGGGGRVNFFSSSKKQRRLAISEADILRWANSKLQLVQPLGAAQKAAAAAGSGGAASDSADSNNSSSFCGSDAEGRRLGQLAQLGSCKMSTQPNAVEGHSAVVGDAVVRPKIASFRDPVLQSGVVLLQLLHVLDPSAVDLAFVTPGLTPAQRQSNAKYALSVADKMGCSLFLVWEDLVDLQPRMVLVLLASLMYMDQTRGRQQQQQQQQQCEVPAQV
jgi:hypothetical protein